MAIPSSTSLLDLLRGPPLLFPYSPHHLSWSTSNSSRSRMINSVTVVARNRMQSAASKESEHRRRSSRFAPRFSAINQGFSEHGDDHEGSLSVAELKAIVEHLKDYGWRMRALRSGLGIQVHVKGIEEHCEDEKGDDEIAGDRDKNNVVGESSVKD